MFRFWRKRAEGPDGSEQLETARRQLAEMEEVKDRVVEIADAMAERGKKNHYSEMFEQWAGTTKQPPRRAS